MPRKYTDVSPADALVILGGVEYDRWIVGTGPDTDTEYVIHLSEPMFAAKYSDADDDDPDAPNVLGAGGLSIEIEGTSFFDIFWLGPPEYDEAALLALFRAANDAITRYSLGGGEEGE